MGEAVYGRHCVISCQPSKRGSGGSLLDSRKPVEALQWPPGKVALCPRMALPRQHSQESPALVRRLSAKFHPGTIDFCVISPGNELALRLGDAAE